MLSSFRWLKDLAVRHLSKPVRDRVLLAHVQKHPVSRIVQLGLGDGQRLLKLIESAQGRSGSRIELAGIDEFEMRSTTTPGLTLKGAHRLLHASGAKVRLVPGDPLAALATTANVLTKTDLLLISADQCALAMTKAWFYVPRMLHGASAVFVEQPAKNDEGLEWRRINRDEVERLASRARIRRAA